MTRVRRAALTLAPLLTVLVAIVLISCGPAQTSAGTTSAPATAVVHIRNFGFRPGTVTVRVGGTVTWINEDQVDHTATADSGAWDSETLAQHQRFSHRFDQAGIYHYHCAFHAFMNGTVRVRD